MTTTVEDTTQAAVAQARRASSRLLALCVLRRNAILPVVPAPYRLLVNEDVVTNDPRNLEALLSRIAELERERDEARAWAWSQWHRYFDPRVTDRRHPPSWLETPEVPAAWTAPDDI